MRLLLSMAMASAVAAQAAPGPTNFGIDALDVGRGQTFAFGALAPGVPVLGGGASPGVVANGFESFTIDAQVIDDISNPFFLTVFGGAGFDFGGQFGRNFTAADYELQLDFKPLPDNAASGFGITMKQFDGFNGGVQTGEEFRWDFFDIQAAYDAGVQDGDGFVTLTRDITALPNFNNPANPDPWDFRQAGFAQDGDATLDTDVFQAGAPNGVTQVQLQTPFGSTDRLNVELRSFRWVKKNPAGEVGRLDAGGFDFQFGSFNEPGAVTRDNGVDSLTNLVLDVQDTGGPDLAFGGAGIGTVVDASEFDGTTHSVEVIARRLPENAANSFNVLLFDLDGNDDAPGAGAETYVLGIDTAQFSDSEFTTVYAPISAAFRNGGLNGGFTNEGDNSIADFDLYEMQIQSQFGSALRLNMEIESIRVVPTPVVAGDYNGDLVVDAADYTVWRDSEGLTGAGLAADGDGDGDVDGDDYTFWATRFGNGVGAAEATAVPEPAAAALLALAAAFLSASTKRLRVS